MKTIIILESNQKVLHHLEEVVKLSCESTCIPCSEEAEVEKILTSKSEIVQMMIISITMLNRREELVRFLTKNDIKIPTIIFSTLPLESIPYLKKIIENSSHQSFFLKRPKEMKLIPQYIEQIDKIKEDLESTFVGSFKPFLLENIYTLSKTPVDIFLKLSKDKYVKILNQCDEIVYSNFHKYKQQGAKNIYIESSQLPILLQTYIDNLIKALENRRLSVNSMNRDHKKISSLIYEHLKELTISETLLASIDQLIGQALKSISENSDIFQMINKVTNKDNYFLDHSIAIAYLACAICKQTKWSSSETLNKLIMSALFHDISLQDVKDIPWDSFAKDEVTNSDKIEYSLKKVILNHPIDSSAIIKLNGCHLPDVEVIIEQHHEKPDGTGYPKGLFHNQILPLTAIFIVAEDFITQYFLNIDEPSAEQVMAIISPKYHDGNFSKAYTALEKVLNL